MRDINPELLAKYLAKKATAEEIFEVETWMQQNEINRTMLQKLVHPPEGVKIMLSVDAEKDWLKVQKHLSGHQVFFNPVLKIAASLAIAVLIGFSAYQFFKAKEVIAFETIRNTDQEARKISMEDGSTVYLNTGAEIIFPRQFKDNRTLQLTGEGFFEVHRDESNPFTVKAQQCEVQVLGTSFSVKADTATVEVIVKTGKVRFASFGGKDVQLEKNERGLYTISTGDLAEMVHTDLNALSWQTNILVFDNTELSNVVDDLERHFRKEITLSGNLKDVPRYTSRFDHPTLNEVLEEMKLVLPMDYQVVGDGMWIKVISE
jgi:transmembrane sensor